MLCFLLFCMYNHLVHVYFGLLVSWLELLNREFGTSLNPLIVRGSCLVMPTILLNLTFSGCPSETVILELYLRQLTLTTILTSWVICFAFACSPFFKISCQGQPGQDYPCWVLVQLFFLLVLSKYWYVFLPIATMTL